jgi:6-phosphogluconolactonase
MTEYIVSSKIIISDSIEELSEQFAQLLLNKLNESKNYFHVALSGGSTPKIVYKYLSENYRSKIDWGKIKLFWGDERCVPPDHPESNYKMANDNLISRVNIPQENIFRIHGEVNPSDEVTNYSNILLANISVRANLPEFDLILLGLGEDGHTVSIFPNSLNLFNEEAICAVAEHPITHQKRITLTGRVINNAKQVIFLVTGESKSNVADIILNKKYGFEKLPAYRVNPSHGELIWLMDEAASSFVKEKTD